VPRIASSALEVRTSFIPATPSEAVDGGFFTLVVSARNPEPYPIVALLDPQWTSRTFFYTLLGPAGGLGSYETMSDLGVTYFKAGETKTQYFDLNLGGAVIPPHTVSAGSYTLYAGFGQKQGVFEGIQLGASK
jgi:hypothetical protein